MDCLYCKKKSQEPTYCPRCFNEVYCSFECYEKQFNERKEKKKFCKRLKGYYLYVDGELDETTTESIRPNEMDITYIYFEYKLIIIYIIKDNNE
jgi:hypothetical protein